MSGNKVVGVSVEKVDGYALACGRAKYVADLEPRGLLHARILTSPHAHARITKIDISKAEALKGVHAVLCHTNVPRIAHTTAGQGFPEPSPYDSFLFDNKVRFVGDKVAVVAAETQALADEAVKLIEVEYEVLPAVFDAKEALKEGAPVIHDEEDARVIVPITYEPERNLASHVDMDIGDVEKGCAEADVVVDKEYYAHYGSHCCIEPHTSMAWLDADDRIIIRTSTQVPFHVRRITSLVLGVPVKNIRVIKPRIGGGFGGKQEVLLEPIVAMLAQRTRRPVLLEFDRKEEFVSTRTRHPHYVRVKLGAKNDGKLTAIEMRVLCNTGAYGSHALTVSSNCGSKVLPLYHAPNVRFVADGVYTNLPVGGAYRGYGATQAAFAMECQMDELARELEMDPVELRKVNHIRTGESSKVFEVLGEGKAGVAMTIGSCGLEECIEKGMAAIGWGTSRPKQGKKARGVGVACLMQGSSIPGIDMGAASMKMNDDGSFNLHVGATDLGTGSDTVLAQIAGEVLGIGPDRFIVYSSDTDMTPFDVGAYASSTTYLSGMAAKKCAEKVRQQILMVAGEMLECDPSGLSLADGKVVGGKEELTLEQVARRSLYMENQFQIAAHASHITHKSPPPFAAHFVEVEVDRETGQVKLLKYVAAVDCGTAINPKLAEGQTEGAVMNGISYALTEEYIFDDNGRMRNPSFRNYKIFSTADVPEMVTIMVPTYEETGPYGAKSVSELSINGALPAISNAIYDAVGVRMTHGPFTAQKVLAAIRERGA